VSYRIVFILALLLACRAVAQQQYELDSDWRCAKAGSVPAKGDQISRIGYPLTGWLQATVPGTVLTSLLDNNLIPDPLYGMNNKQIPDIYDIGRDYYTYWFVKDFDEKAAADDKVWLILRGVNYSCDIFLNGHKLNETPDKGMYLRHSYDITTCLSRDGHNRLAIIVYPPDPVGKPNGGQGGDGTIAHSVTDQFTAGWDWIQPVHDRNTGIWDKVFIKKTKQVYVEHTHIVTSVPGRRMPEGQQKPATIKVTAEIENTSDTGTIEGVAQYELEGRLVNVRMTLEPQTMQVAEFPPVQVDSPRLWWPNGSGPQDLYHIKVRFLVKGKAVSDEEQATFGIRELKYVWNTKTQSREIRCNGQRIFIKGGNRILSDELLRFSPERYDAEIRYHRDMNLNLIRVWGGGITERPEFYDACDKYGLLVMQDLWVSGDCNGRWYDPLKAEDTFARRNYPDDHQLFTECVEDQIYMLRNHPSLAIWCGGNEITPPQDILTQIRDSLLPRLDGSRIFFPYSNDDSMSYQAHDGPYTIQRDTTFWAHRSWGFNSEVGSVGIGDVDALERFIPKKDLVPPHYDRAEHKWVVDSVWQYHKYSGYDSVMEQYGHPNDIGDFTRKAQLINYNQYRALIEGFTARMWEWYTGVIVWKTQNPWTAMVGQMYDTYLDPNACLYGTQEGAKPVHIMYNPVKNKVLIANNTSQKLNGLIVSYDVYQTSGTRTTSVDKAYNVSPHTVISCKPTFPMLTTGGFLQLHLYDSTGLVDENTYWLPDKKGSYEWLAHIPAAHISTTMKEDSTGKLTVSVSCTDKAGLAFFLHITIVDKKTHKRILPVFCNNNYFSVVAGGSAQAVLEFEVPEDVTSQLCIEGWNVQKTFIDLKD
jgi:mannosylglycoprotein endo-beta-mannosidase